eukprot:6140096-Karenia_brevis.AAC.1
MGHAVYRRWCEACARARAKEWGCRRDDGRDKKMPEYVWDQCFPEDELGFRWTILVGRRGKPNPLWQPQYHIEE